MVIVRAESLSIDGAREVSSPVVVVVLLRLLLRVPVAGLRTRWSFELACCIWLRLPDGPCSGLRVEGSRLLEVSKGRLPERARLRLLITGPCRLSVGGPRLLRDLVGLVGLRIMLGVVGGACLYGVDLGG